MQYYFYPEGMFWK